MCDNVVFGLALKSTLKVNLVMSCKVANVSLVMVKNFGVFPVSLMFAACFRSFRTFFGVWTVVSLGIGFGIPMFGGVLVSI